MSKDFNWDDYEDAEPEAKKEFSWDDYEDAEPEVSMGESALRGVGQGASLGFSDEIIAGGKTILDDIGSVFSGSDKPQPEVKRDKFDRVSNPEDLQSNYSEIIKEERLQNELAKESNPATYLAGEVGGGIGTMFVPGLNIAKGAKLGQIAKTGALAGGITGAGYSKGEDLGGIALDAAIGAGIGGAAGVVGEKVLSPLARKAGQSISKAGGKASKLADKGLKKIGKVFSNIDEDVIEKYLANPEKYKTFKTIGELKDVIDDKIFQKKLYVESLKDTVDSLDNQYKNIVSSKKDALTDEAKKLKDQLTEAKGIYRQATRDLKYELRNTEVPPLAIEQVGDAIQAVKDSVTDLSSEAFDVLSTKPIYLGSKKITAPGEKAFFPKSWIQKAYKTGLQELEIEPGIQPISGDSLKGYKQLKSELETLASYPDRLKLGSIKKILQQLDSSINFSENFGDVNSPDVKSKKAIRNYIDTALKKMSPSYSEKMEEVATKTKFLSQLNQRFGNPDKVRNRVLTMHKSRATDDRALFKQLQSETGTDFSETINPIRRNLQHADDPRLFDSLSEALPENKALIDAQDSFNAGLTKQSDITKASTQYADDLIGRDLNQNKELLSKAQEELKSIGVSAKNSEALVRRFENGSARIEDENIIRRLSPDLIDELEKARVGGAFLRGDTAGSRKVLAGAVTGGTPGAVAGFVLDKYSGKLFKQFLNGKITADKLTPKVSKALGKFAAPLLEASKKGGRHLAVTNFILQQRNPEYREIIQSLEDVEDEENNQ